MRKNTLFKRGGEMITGLLLLLLTSQVAFAAFTDDYQFNTPVNLGSNINTPYNDYGMSLTADGNTMYFASNRPGGYGGIDIYVSHRLNGEWQPAVNIGPAVNNGHYQYEPTISPDGTRLYFASDEGRPNYRYSRIWVSEIVNGVPQPATVVPTSVNFSWANNNPRFITSDGNWLYWRAWGGIGYWDIYRVDLTTGDYSVIEHLPAPVNGYYRDFPMYATADYKYLLFTSDRGHLGTFTSYVSEVVNGVYQTPETLPSPFNNFATYVDMVVLAEDETIAYFDASHTAYGYGGWDIYYTTQEGYGNQPPVADAGPNVNIASEEIATTVLQGYASDPDEDDSIECRWLAGDTILLDWAVADPDGQCQPLDLGTAPIGLGAHTLTLEVTDGLATSNDQMILTIANSAPDAVACGSGVYSLGTSIELCGSVSDFDGDLVDYQWAIVDGPVFCSGSIQTIEGGTPSDLEVCTVSGLAIGTYEFRLQVQDGINAPESSTVVVEVVDSEIPTLAPTSNLNMLWPPNHQMVDIVIAANATDNSGAPVTLTVEVASSEPQDGLGDGDTSPDWSAAIIDQATGTISLQLRAESSGTGDGRTYTLVITATDESDNSSHAVVEVLVPHDKRKK
ncbi:MAG: hypothetical protein ABFS45_10740 [Pseudomonadota bacterium]